MRSWSDRLKALEVGEELFIPVELDKGRDYKRARELVASVQHRSRAAGLKFNTDRIAVMPVGAESLAVIEYARAVRVA